MAEYKSRSYNLYYISPIINEKVAKSILSKYFLLFYLFFISFESYSAVLRIKYSGLDTGFDDTASVTVKLRAEKKKYAFYTSWQKSSSNTTKEYCCIHREPNYFGSVQAVAVQSNNAQSCKANPAGIFKSQDKHIILNIDCKTRAFFVAPSEKLFTAPLKAGFTLVSIPKIIEKESGLDKELFTMKYRIESSNNKVAEVMQDGLIKLKERGETTISFYLIEDYYIQENKYEYTLNVI